MKARDFRWPASIMQLDGYRFKEPKCPSSKPITLFTVLHLQYSLTMTDSMGQKEKFLSKVKKVEDKMQIQGEKTRILNCLAIECQRVKKAVLRKRKLKIMWWLVAPWNFYAFNNIGRRRKTGHYLNEGFHLMNLNKSYFLKVFY